MKLSFESYIAGLVLWCFLSGLVGELARCRAAEGNPAGGALPQPVYEAAPAITALAFSPDGTVVAVGGWREILLLAANDLSLRGRLRGAPERVESIVFIGEKDLMVAGGKPAEQGGLQRWDWTEETMRWGHRTGRDVLSGLCVHEAEGWYSAGSAEKTVRVGKFSAGQVVHTMGMHTDWVVGTALDSSGNYLISAGRDQLLKLSRTEDGVFLQDLDRARDVFLAMAGSQARDWVVTGAAGGHLRIYRFPTEEELAGANKQDFQVRQLERQPGDVQAVTWSTDGKRLAAGCETGEVRVYEADSGKRLARLQAGDSSVFGLAFAPGAEARELAVGGWDGVVRVWDVPEGKVRVEEMPFPVAGE